MSADEWALRYEAVRRQAVEEQHSLENGWELALLARRGVVAWMRAWSAMGEPQPRCHHANSHTDFSQAAQITIPSSVSEQITLVMVSMILSQRPSPPKSVS
jgi:hypothetical protein